MRPNNLQDPDPAVVNQNCQVVSCTYISR